jgi:hypothetical protein
MHDQNVSPFRYGGKTSAKQFSKKGKTVLADGTHSRQEILKAVMPGAVWYNASRTHTGLYIGDGITLESAGTETPDYKNISPQVWKDWRTTYKERLGIKDVTKPSKKDWRRGGVQLSNRHKFMAKQHIAPGKRKAWKGKR